MFDPDLSSGSLYYQVSLYFMQKCTFLCSDHHHKLGWGLESKNGTWYVKHLGYYVTQIFKYSSQTFTMFRIIQIAIKSLHKFRILQRLQIMTFRYMVLHLLFFPS